MDKSIILGLVQNTAMLLAFSMIYDYSWMKHTDSRTLLQKVVTGLVIGCIAIVLMLTPWKQFPGLVFDTRSVLLSLAGLFFGFLPTLIAAVMAVIFRFSMGGAGVWMGIAVIISSGSIGLLWRMSRPNWGEKKYIIELAALGFTVHLTMLACTFLLPAIQVKETMKNILVPLLTIYPAGTVLLGLLMVRQYANWQNRKASEKLHALEQGFTGMLKNTLLFSLIIDKHGKLSYCNDPFLKVVGYSPGEVMGKDPFGMFLSGDSSSAVRDAFDYILNGNTGYYNFESELLTKGGEKLIVSWNITVFRDENNVTTSVACIGENITIRKKAEAELIKAKTKAEESDKLKSIFLTNMSHEIRTPMNAIMGFSNLLGDSGVSETEKKQYVEIIKSASDRLLKIINDIIDVSKIEARQLSVNLSECDLNSIISTSVESFRKSELLFSKPELELVYSDPGINKEVKFISDPHRFQQVLDNLISNAIKYTEKGKVEVGYDLSGENSEKWIEVFVKDTGIGIPGEKHEIIFERFRQVEEGRFHEGAGLGLSISKGIIDIFGGKIWFTSDPGKGTNFYFRVPYIIPERINPIEFVSGISTPDLRGKTVIIAEDDYNSYYYLRLLLEGLNANILYAENGYVLMNLVRHRVPDLILLDINMPIMSGFDCLKVMREENIKTVIIAQTAYSMPEEKAKCLEEGCSGYIAKPFRKSELLDVINEVFSSAENRVS